MDAATVGVIIAVAVVALVIGGLLDRLLISRSSQNRLARAEKEAELLLAEARTEAEVFRAKHIEKAQEDVLRKQEAVEREQEETRRALRRARKKLEQRQEKLNQRTRRLAEQEALLLKATDALDALRQDAEQNRRGIELMRRDAEVLLEGLEERERAVRDNSERAEELRRENEEARERLNRLCEEQRRRLEHVSGMTAREAREALLEQFQSEAKLEAASRIKEIRDEAKLTANRQARKIILNAIQRTAASHAIENTVSVVNIPSDEMKGRIIGREGRNIRAFEAVTGIEVIVDDTPEAVILSGFDPVRREIARIALNRLVQDGRIHPARIEEVVEKVRTEIEDEIIETGERTIIDLNLHGIHPELVRLVGRMRYRTSYGQNLLAHSIETARIASLMASELNLDAALARRAGLLHDIGKVVEEDIENPHAIVGMELCQKYKEHPDVCNAVGAHHDEIEMTCFTAPIVQAADAISGARPGARREALESYIKRLEKLEQLASSFEGVERVYAIQAGREIRVLVNHELVSDAQAELLAMDISSRIQQEVQYPGQIKVTVIREVRSVSYAK